MPTTTAPPPKKTEPQPPPPVAAPVADEAASQGYVSPYAHATPARGEPVWPLADLLFPRQGEWTPEQFLKLDLNRTELVDGCLEFLPVGNEFHQDIVLFLVNLLRALLSPGDRGKVMFAPFKVRMFDKNFREPDVIVMLRENYARRSSGSWQGADLAVEIVSEDDPQRDYETKRAVYAAAGFREYWIVDPIQRLILLLSLDGDAYRDVGTYRPGESFASPLIDGLTVDVAAVFAAADAAVVGEG